MLQVTAMERSATFHPTGRYRYSLEQRWSQRLYPGIIMLNPNGADGSLDDSTLRRCIGLAQCWGFGAIAVVNLFAYRSPQPNVLRQFLKWWAVPTLQQLQSLDLSGYPLSYKSPKRPTLLRTSPYPPTSPTPLLPYSSTHLSCPGS